MNLTEIAQCFLNHEPIPGASFEHNDYVRIAAGEHSGKNGSLVTITQMSPEPIYLVEVEFGGDVEIAQSQLRHADA
jgi:hypothetical protein